jgi:hypothetical protein
MMIELYATMATSTFHAIEQTKLQGYLFLTCFNMLSPYSTSIAMF